MYPPSLLDTDILSKLFKGHNLVKRKASEYIREHSRLTISHITKYGILTGLKAKKAQKQIDAFIIFCRHNIVLPITVFVQSLRPYRKTVKSKKRIQPHRLVCKGSHPLS